MSQTSEIKKIEKGLKKDYRAKIFMEIAKQPASFNELLEKNIVSRRALWKHLKKLEQEGYIYRHMIEPTETLNSSEIGKIVYKIKEDEMENFLMQTIHMNFTIAGLVEDEELRKKLDSYAREIAIAISQYLNELRANREQSLKAELKRIKKK